MKFAPSASIRAVYDVAEGVRFDEVHGDLLFAGAEQVLRTVDRDTGEFRAAILDVSRLDSVNTWRRAFPALRPCISSSVASSSETPLMHHAGSAPIAAWASGSPRPSWWPNSASAA